MGGGVGNMCSDDEGGFDSPLVPPISFWLGNRIDVAKPTKTMRVVKIVNLFGLLFGWLCLSVLRSIKTIIPRKIVKMIIKPVMVLPFKIRWI
ncbi:MAG: hypothetical protein AXA67_10830 [Methylothermaceae bacteria B42]|nr:MAG: hypothetical protein AXA67_10830 [Methylothermaceae bacteria B42]